MQQRAQDMNDAAKEATEKAAKHVHEKVPSYKGASGLPMMFKNLRQRIFVIKSIEEGSITVPYRRTGELGRAITTEVKPVGTDWVGTIGTNTVYAPYVISNKKVGGRGPQTKYHQAGGAWYTLQQVVEDCRDAITRIYRTTVVNKIKSH